MIGPIFHHKHLLAIQFLSQVAGPADLASPEMCEKCAFFSQFNTLFLCSLACLPSPIFHSYHFKSHILSS